MSLLSECVANRRGSIPAVRPSVKLRSYTAPTAPARRLIGSGWYWASERAPGQVAAAADAEAVGPAPLEAGAGDPATGVASRALSGWPPARAAPILPAVAHTSDSPTSAAKLRVIPGLAATVFLVAACRSCGAPIIWARHHETGRVMPLDREPDPGGSWLLEPSPVPGKRELVAYYVPPERLLRPYDPSEGRARRTSHFATCPQADEWRRRGDPHE
jgi:hypothetical protein